MKLYAHVILPDTKKAQELVRVWGDNFNPESSIFIKGNQAKVNFAFEDSPKEMTAILSECEIVEFSSGRFETFEEESTYEVVPKEVGEPVKKKKGGVKGKTDVPILNEISNQAVSFDDFVTKVGKWLEMQSLQDIFVNIVQVSCTMEHISWNPIEEALAKKNITFSHSIKMKINKKVTTKLKGYFSRTLSFLQALKDYKDYSFGQAKIEEQPVSIQPVKMDCMPGIEAFNRALQETLTMDSREDKVNHILSTMGIDKEAPAKKYLLASIFRTAIEQENIDLNSVFDSINIPEENRNERLMMLSTFINNYLKENGCGELVKAVDFLRDLRKVVLYKEKNNE